MFHLGSLLRLNELGWLARLDAISSISGGSFVGGWLCLNWPKLDFAAGRARNLDAVVIEPLRKLCRCNLDTLPTLANAAVSLAGGTHRLLELGCRRLLFGAARLEDLPEHPRCLIMSCNLETGAAVTFGRDGLEDSRRGSYIDGSVLLAEAVAASAAYPPYLAPVVLKTRPERWNVPENCRQRPTQRQLQRLVLVDGGMLDPLGLRPVWGRYSTLLFSDASQSHIVWRPGSFWLRQLARTTLMQTCSNSALIRTVIREVHRRKLPGLPEGAYWGNDSKISEYNIADPVIGDSPETLVLSRVRTRLAPFSEAEQTALINWGYALCDVALRERFNLANEPSARLPA